MNKQRHAVYDMRRMVLEGKDTREHLLRLVDEVVEWYADSYCSEKDSPVRTGPRGPPGRPQGDLRHRADPRRAPHARPRRDGGEAHRAHPAPLRGARAPHRHRAHALPPAHDHAADRGHPVEGPPVLARPPQGGHRAARLRPARPPRRVQEGVLPDVPGAHGPDRRGDPALELPLPAGRSARAGPRGARRSRSRRPAARPAAPRPRRREPELAMAGVKTVPRNLSSTIPRRRPRPSPGRRSLGRPREGRTRSRRSAARGRRSGGTTPAPAGAARSTRSATEVRQSP